MSKKSDKFFETVNSCPYEHRILYLSGSLVEITHLSGRIKTHKILLSNKEAKIVQDYIQRKKKSDIPLE